jgi:hypothetical protein
MNGILNVIVIIVIAVLVFALIGWVASLIALPVLIWTCLKVLVVIFAVVAAIDALRGGSTYTIIR